MDTKTKAVKTFMSGKNCAQSVLLSFAGKYNLDPAGAENLTSGFGAGMGRLHKTCGALTGSFMVIGLHNADTIQDADARGASNIRLIQAMETDFSREFGSGDCGLIINTDLNTEAGRKKFSEENIKENICAKCVEFCANWMECNLQV